MRAKLILCVILAIGFQVITKPTVLTADDEGTTPAQHVNELQDAMERGVEYLRALATDDDEGWFFPPRRSMNRRRVGERTVEVRYRRETVQRPVYEYNDVEVYRNVRVGDSVDAVTVRQKVTERRRGRQIGTREEERLIRDPEGSVVRQETRPIWEHDVEAPDEWRAGQFGQNAMAAYAMIRTGVDPSDGVIITILDNLTTIYESFGLPDWTWDVAWSATALSMSHDNRHRNMAKQLAGRLLDGQITSGPAAGLWGPTCINTELLAALWLRREQLSEELLSARARFEERGRRSDEELAERAHNAVGEINKEMQKVSMTAHLQMRNVGRVRLNSDMAPSIDVAMPADHIFNQQSADIESTAVAMFALAIAGRQELVPMETERPLDASGRLAPRPFTTPVRAGNVLSSAMQNISRAQNQNGIWTETNIIQPVTAFREAKSAPGVVAGSRPPRFPAIENPATFTATMQGAAALNSIGMLGGPGAMAQLQQRIGFVGGIALPWLKELQQADYSANIGGRMPPFEAFFHISGFLPSIEPEAAGTLREKIITYLLEAQTGDGSWRARGNTDFLPSSYRARMEVLPGLPRHARARREFDYSQPHVPVDKEDGHFARIFRMHRQVAATAYALLSLADIAEQLQD